MHGMPTKVDKQVGVSFIISRPNVQDEIVLASRTLKIKQHVITRWVQFELFYTGHMVRRGYQIFGSLLPHNQPSWQEIL